MIIIKEEIVAHVSSSWPTLTQSKCYEISNFLKF